MGEMKLRRRLRALGQLRSACCTEGVERDTLQRAPLPDIDQVVLQTAVRRETYEEAGSGTHS